MSGEALGPAEPFTVIPQQPPRSVAPSRDRGSHSAPCSHSPCSLALPSAWVQPCQGPHEPLGAVLRALQGAPAARTETRPVLRTLLHCEGCGDPSPCCQGKPTHTRWFGQQSHSQATATRAGVSALGCRVWAPEAAGLSAAPGQRPPAPRTPSPRASELQPGGRVGTAVLGDTGPCRAAGKALLSPVEIKHRMGMGREGVWQQPAAGSGRGLGGGILLCPPGGFACSAAPTYQGLHSTAARVGCPTAGSSKAPAVPVLRGSSSSLRPRPRTRNTPCPGLDSRGGGERGLESLYPV